jgi:hypothetical protein
MAIIKPIIVELNRFDLIQSQFERNKTERIASLCTALASIKDDKSTAAGSSYYAPESDRAKLLQFLSNECLSVFAISSKN